MGVGRWTSSESDHRTPFYILILPLVSLLNFFWVQHGRHLLVHILGPDGRPPLPLSWLSPCCHTCKLRVRHWIQHVHAEGELEWIPQGGAGGADKISRSGEHRQPCPSSPPFGGFSIPACHCWIFRSHCT